MNKLIVPIAGMHCRSCEILMEEKLSEIPKVCKTQVSYKKGVAEIFYTTQKPSIDEIETVVRESGYTVGSARKKQWFSRNANDYRDLGLALVFAIALYFLFRDVRLSEVFTVGGAADKTGVSVALLVGLAAGFSTCLALVGGLVLGVSARYSEEHPEATPTQKFRPHLFFNGGRVIAYVFLGGMLGLAGASLQLSGAWIGVVTLLVGVVMLFLGLRLMGVFPRLETLSLTLPKGLSRFLGFGKHTREYSHRHAFGLGALTFFLPCGFTQAMQVYAVSTGSFIQGSLVMGLFALGTMPGLLGIGGLTSFVKGIFARRFFAFTGIIVVALAIFNIGNGLSLVGWRSVEAEPKTQNQPKAAAVKSSDPNVKMENGVQVVRMVETGRGYTPNKFTLQKGIPVKWIIDAREPYSCASSLVSSKLGISRNLIPGENVIEFTPKQAGVIPFSCSMGMYRGLFTVVGE